MPITITCPECRKTGKLPDAMAGKTVACPACKHRFPVPAPKQDPSLLSSLLDEDDEDEDEDEDAEPIQHVRSARNPAPSGSGSSTMVYAMAGLGGVAALLLVTVVVLMWPRSEPRPDKPKRDEVAEVEPRPEPAPPTPVAFVPAAPAAADHAAVVARVRDATVFLKLSQDNKVLGSGTGFVIRVQGDMVLIATNRHVAVPDEAEGKLEITAVFRSGEPGEQSLPAEVVAADLSGEMDHDLALLRVRGVTKPMMAINPGQAVAASLGIKYAAYGYPLSTSTNFNSRNPTITRTTGTVSGLRPDEAGALSLLQLDGSIQPGNSGGPIVDDNGQLVGVAVAKLSAVDTIGLAIPSANLRELLSGRVGAINLALRDGKTADPELQLSAQIVDPDGRIASVKVMVAPAATAPKLALLPDGSWPQMPGVAPVDLKLEGGVARGNVRVAVGPPGKDARRVLVQTSHIDTSGKTIYSAPREIILPDQDGIILSGGKMQELTRKLARKSFARLGALVEDLDPKTPDVCKSEKDEDKRRVTISLPPETLTTLSPKIKGKSNKPVHNAPRMLTDVDGDFVAIVKVSGEINPGIDLIKDPKGVKIPFTFQGGGLLLYQDKDNFLRLERACIAKGLTQVRELLVEVVRNGEVLDYYYIPLPGDPRAPIDLLLIRRGDRVKLMFSFDDRTLFAFHDFALDYPAKMKVGFSATNVSKKPFSTQFENFIIADGAAMPSEEFGEK